MGIGALFRSVAMLAEWLVPEQINPVTLADSNRSYALMVSLIETVFHRCRLSGYIIVVRGAGV